MWPLLQHLHLHNEIDNIGNVNWSTRCNRNGSAWIQSGFSLPQCSVLGSLLPLWRVCQCCLGLLQEAAAPRINHSRVTPLGWVTATERGKLMREGQMLCRACGNRNRGNGFKLKAGRFKLGVGQKCSRVKQQNRLHGEGVGAPSLKYSGPGWTQLWESWSHWRCTCSLQGVSLSDL